MPLLFADDEDEHRGWIVAFLQSTFGEDVDPMRSAVCDDRILLSRWRLEPIEQFVIVAQVIGCEARGAF